MKTVKKVLSIVLAVMLAFGTITVAVAALTDGQKAYISLKAEVFASSGAAEVKAYGGEAAYNATKPTTAQKAGQKSDFDAYKKLKAHTYADKSKEIEVEAGQIVWVTFNLKTTGNVYPTFWATAISYTSMFYSLTNTTGCLVANADSSYLNDMEGTATSNFWGLMNTTARAKFINGTDHSYAINYDVSYGADGIADLDEDIYAVPFYVDPDAKVGTTGKIYIPVKTDKVATSVSGFEDGDYSTDSYEMTGDYLDLSGAVLNFKVVGIDYTELNNQISAYEAKTPTDYTETSWATATTKYNEAKNALTSKDQAVINAAATNLKNALAALVEAPKPLDYEAIDAALANVPTDTSTYTTASVAALDLAKQEADTAKATATTQAELNTATTNLNNAINGLVLKADMTALNNAITAGEQADTSTWTTNSKTALTNAINAGKDITAQADNYSDTEAVTAAVEAINNALNNYVVKADMTALNNAITAGEQADTSKWTTDSKTALTNAINAGKAITEQADNYSDTAAVAAAAQAINDALSNYAEKADLTALKAALAAAEKVDTSKWTTDSKTALTNAINAGKAIKDQADNYSDTAAVAAVTKAINDAIANPVLKDADYSAVDAAIAKFNGMNKSLYTSETVKAVEDAITAVIRDYKIDKQEDVDDMATAINNAINKLELLPVQKQVKSVALADFDLKYKTETTIEPEIEKDGDVKYTVEYKSSDESVVKVDKDGKVTATGKGDATITCTVTDEYNNVVTDTCNVHVYYSFCQWLIWIFLFGCFWYF